MDITLNIRRRYFAIFVRVFIFSGMSTEDLEKDLAKEGITYMLIAIPSAIPGTSVAVYFMWLGFKKYIHTH